MKVLGVKVEPSEYKRFKEKAARERLTVSELLRNLIAESFKEKKSLPSDTAFVVRESFRILNEAKTMCNQIPIPFDKQAKLKEFLNIQIRDFQRKLDYEKE